MHATAMFWTATRLLWLASWTPPARQSGIVREAVAMLEARTLFPQPWTSEGPRRDPWIRADVAHLRTDLLASSVRLKDSCDSSDSPWPTAGCCKRSPAKITDRGRPIDDAGIFQPRCDPVLKAQNKRSSITVCVFRADSGTDSGRIRAPIPK